MQKPYKCSQCDYRGRCPCHVKQHENIHSSKKPYGCKFPGCSYSARLPRTLVNHRKRHLDDNERSKGKKFKCSQCNYWAEYPCMLKKHAKVHSEEKSLSCDVPGCDYKTRWQSGMTNHRKLVHEDDKTVWYECDKCDFRTKYEYVLKKRHSQIHAEVPLPKKFKCELCDYGTHVKGRLEEHMRKHTGEEQKIRCEVPGCDFIANWKSCAYRHMQRVHWERIWHKCDLCPYKSWYKTALTMHKKTHSEEKLFRCAFDDCNYRSKNKSALYGHLTRHEYDSADLASLVDADRKQQNSEMAIKIARNLKRFPCTHPGCNHVSKTRTHLSAHLQTHESDRFRTFKCPLCPKMFFTTTCRQQHVGRHTNEKPWKCTYPDCGHRAAKMEDLKKHEHVHETEKSFICDYPGCNYSATRKAYLRRHAKLHASEREPKFRCNLCPLSFYTGSGLRNHVFSHTNEKPFECSTCGYASVHSHLIKKHQCPENVKRNGKNGSAVKVVTPTAQLREDGLYQCNFCEFTSKAMTSVIAHAGSAHTRISKMVSRGTDPKNTD